MPVPPGGDARAFDGAVTRPGAWFCGLGLLAASGCGPGADAGPRAPEPVVMALLGDAEGGGPAAWAQLVDLGRETFDAMQCGQCHRFDAKPATGPSLRGIAGSTSRVDDPDAPDGYREVTADRAWLWESIVHSQANFVKGYEDTTRMSRYAQVLDPEEVAGLIAWLETR